MTLFEQHQARLDAAVNAIRNRTALTPFIESPSKRLHPEGAHEAGQQTFERHLGQPFVMDMPGQDGWIGQETSPYTREPLGITYPKIDVQVLFEHIDQAWTSWRVADPKTRVGVCMEILEQWHQQTFENAYATMHTTGQAFMLSFAGSGASSLDRGLEAVAMAWEAMGHVPSNTVYVRDFAKQRDVTLHKRYRLVPVGVAIVLSCGSYPAWNAYPAIMANLATGNPVVVKPHPDTILPVAIAVQTARRVLQAQGFDPNLVTMVADTWESPAAVTLFDHPMTAIIDFTGGQRFGGWIESHYAHLQVYTETAGCNAVVLESVDDLDAVLAALAKSIVLFSSQMCTAPQNIWMPADGVREGDTRVSPDDVLDQLVEHINVLVEDPKMSAGLCGALHSEVTVDEMAKIQVYVEAHPDEGTVVRATTPYTHATFPNARTATPLIVRLGAQNRALCQREHFGPMVFAVIAKDRDAALSGATGDAKQFGAIASYAYTTDAQWLPILEDAFALAGASVGVNLIRHQPLNFTAAFSDYHVTGLNPAGNACLTDLAFVARRFRIVQTKVEQPHKV